MKRYLKTKCILFVCVSATLLFSSTLFAQLNGNYTINPTKAASNSNYTDWASAIGDLVSGTRTDGGNAQGSGVSGAVVITVYDTVYANTSVTITSITGASNANTITFKSAKGDSSKCKLQYASGTSSTDDYVLYLNGADYITFQRIGLERTGTNTYCTVMQLGGDADNNKFINCLFKGRKMPSSSSLGFSYGIGSCVYYTGNADSTVFDRNRLLYGYNGIYNANSCVGATYLNNLIDTSGSSGIYTTSQTTLLIKGNTFNMGDFGAGSGHYTSYAIRVEVSPGLVIANNKVSMTAVNSQVCRALVIASNTSSAAAPTMIYNNAIYNSGGTGSCTGLAVYNCYYLNFFFNNVLINNSLAEGAAYYQYYGSYTNSNLNLVNNNLVNKGAGYAVDVRDGTNYANVDSFDYNNIYSAGTYSVYWNTVKYTTLSGFQSGSGKGTNCLGLDPGFVSNSDLHVSNIAINGKAMPYPKILFDIDNETRNSSTPDIGSDEFFPITLDAGVSAIDSPALFCAGKQNVKVRFQNYGIDTLKSIQIGWSVNGTAQTGTSWTGKLAPGASSSTINLGAYTFAGNTAYNFRIWTRLPNGSADGKNINDTLKQTKYAAMSGAYTIGDTNIANYKSFSQAITAMTERGICGAVTFNVYNGTFNEQLGIAQLPGMGVNSPVVFQSISKDSTKVKISLASTIANGTNNAALQLRGADYVTFKGITFERTGTNIYAQVIHILNGSTHNTLTNCRMLGLNLATANTNAINIWSDQGKDDYNVFRNNAIKYGHQSMFYVGTIAAREVGTVIEGNTFEGALKNAVQLNFNDSAIVNGNTFLSVNVADTGTSDLYLLDCDKNLMVQGNYFKDNNTANAIWLNSCNATAVAPTNIANNSIVKPNGRGISLTSNDYVNVVFNSMYFSGNFTTNSGIQTNAGASTNTVLKNNNIVMEEGKVVHITANSHVSASNNNNFFANGTQFAYWVSAYSSLSTLSGFTGKDLNSLSVNPMFKSGTDLHILNPLLKRAGTPIIGITKDVDNEIRNTTTPDIGFDEFKLSKNDAGIISLTKPVAGTCAGLLDVEVVIKNMGNDTLKNASLTWSINGLTQKAFAFTGSLASFESDTIVIGTFNFVGLTNPKFIVKSTLPNGNQDAIGFNDSIVLNRSIRALPVANAGADQALCLGDSLLIGSSGGSGFTYRWLTMSNGLISTNAQIYVKPSTTTSYVYEVTNVAFGCMNKDTIKITVNPKPIANAGSDAFVCPGAIVNIGKTAIAGNTYSWTSQPTGYISSVANPNVVPNFTTTYFLQVTITSTGCKARDTVKVNLLAVPTPTITGKSSVCKGEALNYSTKLNAGNTYKWNLSGGSIVAGQNTNALSVNWQTAGVGYVEVIETNASTCKDTVKYNVTINDRPTAAFNINGGACKGSATSFKDASTGATTYEWLFGDGGASTVVNPTHIYVNANTYKVFLIARNAANCVDTTSQSVVINPLPVINFGGSIKGNRSIDLSDSSSIVNGTIAKWRWEFGDGDTSLSQNPSHQFANDGSYTIQLCATSAAGCTNCATKNFNILGIHSIGYIKGLFALPNPTTGIVIIKAVENLTSIEVANAMGQIISTIQLNGNAFTIDLSNQASGIYFVKVTSSQQLQILKLMKQ